MICLQLWRAVPTERRLAWCLVLYLASLILVSMTGKSDAENLPPVKIVAFGTSLTARGGWQPGLQTRLAACLQRPVSVESVAKSGETSTWALTQLDRVLAEQPDIILIELYANDATLHRFVSLAQSRKNIGEILDRLHQRLPRARIILMAMNPFSGLRGLIRPFVDSYILVHQAEAQKRGLEFVDHRPGWERLSPDDLAAAIPDGAHPRPEVASKIIVPELVGHIAGPGCGE
ncbi:SGNH/GDSL hydrolase family protein [Rhizobium bangladeshense]|uniref:SGNH/GDSL hydrolase family protein n=1 Tax=Rhizobium bangladeshense TaxID=1138189 RepID=A0ABS7LBX3_9HYPH|nr:SGNH/GDSL hydrolase family protein [Rhizobium bangladeshense]MBX4866463.1 SGNH/GDSL hydrolase family protein [Rhizobium bangladeshense]MBX4873572.1 SGNH/GDSL hydrolase family protein [Rhizobium bangladeshense]MBX4885429.1 SGNH/GDSL hydrolase family protein [Rhizobium bangladeshense]MBX4934063.1 SGNH/GDSL hydrolase family protein [Rhizobium bangladeshense]MBY3584386.1 SGNH/GDSL hydrolase family protein [Rhizobium bangladeshense]